MRQPRWIHGMVDTPAGMFEIPEWIQQGLDTTGNEELFASLYLNGFINPFVLNEIMARGLYAEYLDWKKAQPA